MKRTRIMGILNITPDSFSDGGCCTDPVAAARRAAEIEAEGADIIDIGPQSTRPGHIPLTAEEEIRRLSPVLEEAAGAGLRTPISIDTFFPETADFALQRGASIVNDVSGGVNPAMAEVVRKHGAAWILTHTGGQPDAADQSRAYEPDVVTAVHAALEQMAAEAQALGIPKDKLILDPGIGFGKTRGDDLRLLLHGDAVKVAGIPLLVGASRKRVVEYAANLTVPEPLQRLGGTVALHIFAQMHGADILRVHDVRAAVQAAAVTDRLRKEVSSGSI
ncbi:MAG: dihydropteroate synthase [Oscillospiraceae bacterium]|jgi:dihydropteroate synthase|nr:dihydropteroate synthase [Oscillospiraceae bacterium]